MRELPTGSERDLRVRVRGKRSQTKIFVARVGHDSINDQEQPYVMTFDKARDKARDKE